MAARRRRHEERMDEIHRLPADQFGDAIQAYEAEGRR